MSTTNESTTTTTTTTTYYTREEVAEHGNEWLIYKNKVYDVSHFDKHPGGADALLRGTGKDATEQMTAVFADHAAKAEQYLPKFYIGDLKE